MDTLDPRVNREFEAVNGRLDNLERDVRAIGSHLNIDEEQANLVAIAHRRASARDH